MRFVLILLMILSPAALAQVYKWTDENGNVHFGNRPPPGQNEEVRIRQSSPGAMGGGSASSDMERRAAELERESRRNRYNSRSDSSNRSASAEDRPDYVCQGAKNRVQNYRDRWQDKRRQGYSISEEQYYKERIREAERHRDNICR